MKPKIQLIISSVSLAVTSLLLILVIFAWYTANKNVDASGIFGQTKGEDCYLTLQRGTYDPSDENADDNGMVWANTSNMAFSNISPGNVFYFRIKIDGESNTQYKTCFDDISSSLVEDKLKVVDSKICLNDGFNTELYTITNGKVTVDSHTLYNVSGETITLDYYQIHTVFYVYDYGATEMAPTESSKVSGEGTAISSFVSDEFTMTSTTGYYYFALEFNEEASIDAETGNSNCYLYQKIYIGHISVEVLQ